MTPEEASANLIEGLAQATFPFDVNDGGPVVGRVLDWIEEVLDNPEGKITAEPTNDVVQATNLIALTSEALLSGSGRQDFIDALGTEDYETQPIGDVIAAQRLALQGVLLNASIEELAKASQDVEAERVLLSEEELKARSEQRNEEGAEALVANLRSGRPPFAGDKGGISPLPVPEGMSLTTQTLKAFQARATAIGLSRILSEDRARQLAPNAYHELLHAWNHTSNEGFKNIRVGIRLHFSTPFERAGEKTEDSTLDILTKDWDMLMVPYKNQQREYGLNKHISGLYLSTPKWEAVRSYPSVHELHSFYQGHLSAYANTGYLPRRIELPQLNYINLIKGENPGTLTLEGDGVKEWLARPRTILGAETCEALHTAHPVVFDPEWVDAQEDWTWAEAWSYASRVVLPYDPLYLDFEGPGGTIPVIDLPGGQGTSLCGCLFSTDDGLLTITPIGPRVLLDNIYWPDIPMGGTPYEMAGRVVIGHPWVPEENDRQLEADEDAFLVTYEGPRGLTDEMAVINIPPSNALADALKGNLPPGFDGDAIPGYVELPLNADEALTQAQGPNGEDDESAEGKPISAMARWAACVLPAAAKSLSMLSLLDNENVELRPYPVTRQVRRNAQRKGIPIASEIVVIRKHRYVDGKRVNESEGHINYSHQFPVRRHEQHHGPHTPAYRAHPEKAKPCGRCGSCRRFVVESYIKGDPNKPLVARKTYIYRDKAP